MGHQETYHHNKDYAEFLSGWETRFYRKYADAMMPENPETSVLDVGCGVGQVVAELSRRGVNVHGVDVSLPNIERARQRVAQCHVYDGSSKENAVDRYESDIHRSDKESAHKPRGIA